MEGYSWRNRQIGLSIDDVQRKIDQAEQRGKETKIISLKGFQTALINERTEFCRLFGQQQALVQAQAGYYLA